MIAVRSVVYALCAALAGSLLISGSSVAAELAVTLAGNGTGTVTNDVGGINCGAACSGTYASGTTITLTATPAGASQFTGWLGPCTGTGVCQFVINGGTTVSATFAGSIIYAPTLDIDGSSGCDTLTDGLLISRYMFGFSGTSLITDAMGSGATRGGEPTIRAYLNDIRPLLDIDGDGKIDALIDGQLISRYLRGQRGGSLINGVLGQNAIRTNAAEIEAQLQAGKYTSGVRFRGINRAGMEYGDDWDGWTGQTFYIIPSAAQTASELAYFKSKGFNTIRLPISWERLQHVLNGPLDEPYVAGVMAYINAATAAGFYIVLDLHNYNRYAQNAFNASGAQVPGYTQRIMGDGVLQISHLADVWVKLVQRVLGNQKVILNLMNEPHDFPLDSTAWFSGIQTVMNAIRATGSTHLILVPNSRGSDVDHWITYAPNGGPLDSVAALTITDSANNYAFDMHAYQDNPASATSYSTLVSTVTAWAKTNKKKLFLSEMGSANAAANGSVGVGGLLSYLNANNDVWLGWTPWNLPPYSITDTSSYAADGAQMPWYAPFLVPSYLANGVCQ